MTAIKKTDKENINWKVTIDNRQWKKNKLQTKSDTITQPVTRDKKKGRLDKRLKTKDNRQKKEDSTTKR